MKMVMFILIITLSMLSLSCCSTGVIYCESTKNLDKYISQGCEIKKVRINKHGIKKVWIRCCDNDR